MSHADTKDSLSNRGANETSPKESFNHFASLQKGNSSWKPESIGKQYSSASTSIKLYNKIIIRCRKSPILEYELI